jgi:hypothetical protein
MYMYYTNLRQILGGFRCIVPDLWESLAEGEGKGKVKASDPVSTGSQ